MADDLQTEGATAVSWEVEEKNESIYNDSDEKGLLSDFDFDFFQQPALNGLLENKSPFSDYPTY